MSYIKIRGKINMKKYDEFVIVGHNLGAVYYTDWNCGYYLSLERAIQDLTLLQDMYPEDDYTLIQSEGSIRSGI